MVSFIKVVMVPPGACLVHSEQKGVIVLIKVIILIMLKEIQLSVNKTKERNGAKFYFQFL